MTQNNTNFQEESEALDKLHFPPILKCHKNAETFDYFFWILQLGGKCNLIGYLNSTENVDFFTYVKC